MVSLRQFKPIGELAMKPMPELRLMRDKLIKSIARVEKAKAKRNAEAMLTNRMTFVEDEELIYEWDLIELSNVCQAMAIKLRSRSVDLNWDDEVL